VRGGGLISQVIYYRRRRSRRRRHTRPDGWSIHILYMYICYLYVYVCIMYSIYISLYGRGADDANTARPSSHVTATCCYCCWVRVIYIYYYVQVELYTNNIYIFRTLRCLRTEFIAVSSAATAMRRVKIRLYIGTMQYIYARYYAHKLRTFCSWLYIVYCVCVCVCIIFCYNGNTYTYVYIAQYT